MFASLVFAANISTEKPPMAQETKTPLEDILSSSAFTAELPKGTPEGIGSTTQAVKRLVIRQLGDPQGSSYLLLQNVPPGFIERITDNRSLIGSRGARICYNCETRQLIVKFPSLPHEVGARSLGKIFSKAFDGLGLAGRYQSLGSGLADNGRVKKEPDDQWAPKPEYLPAGRDPDWSTVVLECGWSESLRQLRRDASIWLCKFGAMTVVIVSIHRQRHEVLLEKWVPKLGQSTRGGQRFLPVCGQTISIKETKSGLLINGPYLRIDFEEFWLRRPTEGESDYVFPHCALEKMADDVWLRQDIWLGKRNEQPLEIPDEDFQLGEEEKGDA
ncbi:hypothetical protein BDV25DRAFT_145054 [Aspergillus avenaceus]|uniref:Uncharacterized protein n=1 Tax=Aspergillus avenaceus TaxID=36643 RepID=A0A5N6TFZ0_ASPAV|nr:hypothetical protein BDV25DRAFT_145054 [Aspergillus avenaceus]